MHKKMVEIEEKICKKVDERMDGIEKLVKDKSEKVKAPESHENKHEQMVDVLMASIDLENVENSLDDLDFGRVVETDEEIVFYCKVCFENNPHNWMFHP